MYVCRCYLNAEPSGVEEVGIQLISLSSPELSRDKEPDPTLRWRKLERERSDKIGERERSDKIGERERSDKIVHNYELRIEWRKKGK